MQPRRAQVRTVPATATVGTNGHMLLIRTETTSTQRTRKHTNRWEHQRRGAHVRTRCGAYLEGAVLPAKATVAVAPALEALAVRAAVVESIPAREEAGVGTEKRRVGALVLACKRVMSNHQAGVEQDSPATTNHADLSALFIGAGQSVWYCWC